VVNWWDKIDDPQNMAIISIPTTLDPNLAPPGKASCACVRVCVYVCMYVRMYVCVCLFAPPLVALA
jgi:phytoene dehydrogenase-like protein